MATGQASAVAEPNDWQTVDDWQTVQPAVPQPKPAALPPLHVTPDISQDMFKAGVHSQMLGVTPGMAYEQRDTIDKTLRERGGNYDDGELDPTFANDIKAGLENSIFGLKSRKKLPDEIHNPGMIDGFVKGMATMVADLPFYAVGGVVGGLAGSEVPVVGNAVGAAAGAFAAPAAIREALVLGIKDGDVKDFPDLLRRAGHVIWAGTKGAVVGAATELTGGLAPVIGKGVSGAVTTSAVKGLFQATALTTAADLLEGHLPTAADFTGNAALIIPLNLITHGVGMLRPEAKQALMDVYAKNGKTPQESAETLNAQPPVKPDAPEGLRPAIQFSEGHIEGESGEDHHGVSERVLGQRPVTMEQLEENPLAIAETMDIPSSIRNIRGAESAWTWLHGELPEFMRSRGLKPDDTLGTSELASIIGSSKRELGFSHDPHVRIEQALQVARAFLEKREKISSDSLTENSLPSRADRVLETPAIHEQDVIDRAWQIKKEAIEAGDFPTVYHGTRSDFEDFGRSPLNTALKNSIFDDAQGHYFTTERASAQDYADTGKASGSPRVIAAKLGINKAYQWEKDPEGILKKWGLSGKIPPAYIDPELRSEIEAAGYDAVRWNDPSEKAHDEWVVFDPKKIKQQSEGEEKPLRIEDLYDRNAMKSGRGFVTPDGQFLSRMEARKWMKDNEPDAHELWLKEQGGDKQAELHTEAYVSARNRAQARSVAEGDPTVDAMPPDLKRFLAEARSTGGILNKIKAGLASEKYGYEAIRTLLVGPRNMIRAEGEQVVGGLRKLVPDKVEQQGLHFYRDYRGELPQLQADIEEIRAGDNEKLKAFLPAMEKAASWSGVLPKNIADADGQMTGYFTKALALGRAAGTLDSAIDPSRYSPRMFMRAAEEGQSSGVGRSQFTDRTVNSIRREYLHTLDPLKSGDTEARTFNALDEMSIYNDRHATAVSTAIFKTELKNSALGVEGSRGKVPASWVALTKQFEDRRTFVQDDGSTVTTVKNLYVPKEIAEALRPLLEDPGQLSQLSKFLHIQSIVKGIELTLSAFHMKALTVTAFNNMGITDFVGAMIKDSNAPDVAAIERRGALYGLETTKTGAAFDAYRGLKPEVEPTGLARLKDNVVVNGVDKFAQGITRVTFDVVQRKWKVMDFAKKEAGWIAKHPEATESEYASAMRSYAKEINAAYGGLNWDVMGVSKGVQNVSRMFLLAPDWTFSNVANLKYALTERGPGANASRVFFLKSFMTGFAATAAASTYFGGKYDPSDVRHMDQVYLGTDKDGKEMYANWFFAGAPKDAMNLYKRSYSEGPIAGLAEIMLSKASPVAGTVVDIAKNKDYKGAPIYTSDQTDLEKSGETAKYAGEKLLPITGVSAFQTMHNALSDPNRELSYTDALELAADLVGSSTTHTGGAKGGESTGNSTDRFQRAGRGGKSRFTIRGKR